jgi:choline dehydrogenase-like flavoprotein
MPMKKIPRGLEVDKFGTSSDLNRIHIVDGSVLPELSEKSHTLTIMANADRIGRYLSSTLELN